MTLKSLLLKLFFSALLLALVVRTVDMSQVRTMLDNISPQAWLTAMGCVFLQIVFMATRWRLLLNTGRGKKIDFPNAMRVTSMSFLANYIFVTGIGGILTRVGLTVAQGFTLTKTIAVTVVDRALIFLTLIILAAIFMPTMPKITESIKVSQGGEIVLASLALAALVCAYAAWHYRRKIIFFNRKSAIGFKYLRDLFTDKDLMFRIALTLLGAQMIFFVGVHVIVESLQPGVSLWQLMAVLPVIAVVSSLPVGYGGWGVREGAFIYGFSLLGIPAEVAFMASVQFGLLSMALAMLVGIPSFVTLKRKNVLKTIDWVKASAILFALTLQIQLTLFKSETYQGLRIGSGDLVLPVIGILIAVSLFLKRSVWPVWPKPFGWWALGGMTAVISFAMVNGYFVMNELSEWALVNKFVGWFVLLAYFGLASWFTSNYGERFVTPFIKYFCIVFIFVACLELSDHLLKALNFEFNVRPLYAQMTGFMGNRNAFAFLTMTVTGIITVYAYNKQLFRERMLYGFWFLFPVLMVFNSSRTLIICTAVMFILLFVANWKKFFAIVLPCFVAGLLLFVIVSSKEQKTYFTAMPIATMGKLYDYTQRPDNPLVLKDAKATGDYSRIEIIKTSWESIKQRPLQGSGLGSAQYFQKLKYGAPMNIIDNSGLWLMTETGLIGFCVFAAAYIAMAIVLFRKVGSLRKPQDLVALSALWMMLFFAGFSLFHELLYTRFLWFILGIALASVVRTRQATQAT